MQEQCTHRRAARRFSWLVAVAAIAAAAATTAERGVQRVAMRERAVLAAVAPKSVERNIFPKLGNIFSKNWEVYLKEVWFLGKYSFG